MMELKLKERAKKLLSNKYLFLLALVGAVLIIIPSGEGQKKQDKTQGTITVPAFSLDEQEKKIKEVVENIDGVGKTKVSLSLKGGVSRDIIFQQDGALVVSAGSGTQKAVESRYLYPEYQGAVIVCQGADSGSVRLAVTDAVGSLTGLKSDKITVIKMKNS